MIKCNVVVCGTISYTAVVKTANDGKCFLSFSVKVPISGRDNAKKDLVIGVSLDGDKSNAPVYSSGRKVTLTGVMNIIKKDGKTYYNLRADSAELANSKTEDKIEGTILFRGKVGKSGIEEKTDKNGKTFKVFSAFSTDKDGDKADFTWVRFLHFSPKDEEDFLQPSAYIECSGELQLGVFKDNISLDCRVRELSKWELIKQ